MTRKERIVERLRDLGVEPKRSLGQNFLISDAVADRIAAAARSEPCSELVEVGPGLGAITEDLLLIARSIGKPLTLLELDRRFAEYWRQRAKTADPIARLKVVEGDALRMSWRELGLQENALFVSNLPYQISSSLVIERSLEPAGVGRMILMFQKEVAQRMRARPSTKEYGLLTVIAQTFWEISIVCDAGPKDFFPQPKVASRVLSFRRRKLDWLGNGATAEGFLRLTKAAFSHRRKRLARNLAGEYFAGEKTESARVEDVCTAMGLGSTVRAEELDPAAFVRLYLALL